MPTAPTWEGRRQVTLSAAFAADPSGLPRRVRPLGVGGRPFPSGCLCSLPCGTGQNAAMWLEVTRRGRVPEGDRKLRTCPLPWRFSGGAPGPPLCEAARCRRSGLSCPHKASLAPPPPAVTPGAASGSHCRLVSLGVTVARLSVFHFCLCLCFL